MLSAPRSSPSRLRSARAAEVRVTVRRTGRAIRGGAGVDLVPAPFLAIVDDAAELTAILAKLHEPPEVETLGIDWATEVAMVTTISSNACPPVLSSLRIDDAVAQPVFALSRSVDMCNDILLAFTTVAAVERSVLAPVSILELPPELSDGSRVAVDVDVEAEVANSVPASTPVQTETEFGSVQGDAAVPAEGEASVATLSDGTPVFVVHHHDGTISALDPRGRDNLEGRTGVVEWSVKTRNFSSAGPWDEYGRRLDGFRSSDLRSFQTRLVGDRVEIGAETATPAGAPIPETVDPVASIRAGIDLGSALSVTDALAEPIGTTVIVDASVVVEADMALVCGPRPSKIFPIARCEPGSPTAAWPPGMPGLRQEYFGPLLATRTASGFDFIAATGGTAGESL